MKTSDLGVTRAVYDAAFYDAINTDMSDLPFYEARCAEAHGAILELCCGSGRLSLPLARKGYDLTGLDLEPGMLEAARAKARAEGLDLSLVEGDMRRFDLGRSFDLVFIPFNSLQNTYAREDVEAIFRSIKKHLRPTGRFVFDVFNPDFRLMVDRSAEATEQHGGVLPDGRTFTVLETCAYDAATQVNRVSWTFCIGDERRNARLDMRCFYPMELEALLHYNGWSVEALYGSFDGSPFTSASPKQIFVCRMA